MVFMNTHKQIHTLENNKQAICAVSSLRSVMYDFEMHFYAFWWPPKPPRLPQKNIPPAQRWHQISSVVSTKYVEPLWFSTERSLFGSSASPYPRIHRSPASQTQKDCFCATHQSLHKQMMAGRTTEHFLHKTSCMQRAVKKSPLKVNRQTDRQTDYLLRASNTSSSCHHTELIPPKLKHTHIVCT